MSRTVSEALLLASALATAASAVVVAPKPTTYVRRTYTVKVPFFTKYWWVGFIIMFLVFLVIVWVLYIAVRCHFQEAAQYRRRKEVEMSHRDVEDSGEEVSVKDTVTYDRSSSNPLRSRPR